MNTDSVYLVDTSAWILVLRKDAPEKARDFIDQLIVRERAASTGVIFLELLAGSKSEQEFEELKQELEALVYFPVPHEFWIKGAILYSALRKKAITVPTIDTLIATIALENGAAVLHADKHFDWISQFTNLKAKNLTRNI